MKDSEVKIYKTEPNYERLWEDRAKFTKEYLEEALGAVKPGDKVVIKPNFVKESHMYKPDEWDYVITHPVLIRIVLEFVLKKLNGCGEVIIADAPQTDSDFDKIMEKTGLPQIISELQKSTTVRIRCFDLREERWYYKEGIIVKRKKLFGDPKGYVKINLKDKSEFVDKKCKRYYGADYDMDETKKYHNEVDNIYVMSRTILNADVFINMPKLKTHKLAGVTISLKNLVGACVVKNSIPHHTLGSPKTGGDKFMVESAKNSSESALKGAALKLLKAKNPIVNYPFIFIKKLAGMIFGSSKSKTIRNGMWYGNDTIWRSVLDLNKIVLYADKDGHMCGKPQRKYISIVDGILGGERNGPMEPDKKESGVILIGCNPVAVDTVGAVIMGFDYHNIPSLFHGYQSKGYRLTNFDGKKIKISSNYKEWEKQIGDFKRSDTLCFKPHFGWEGHIELLNRSDV